MGLYSGVGYIRANGQPCVRAAEIDISVATGNTSVKELIGGRTGHSKGAKEYQVTVTQSIPASGFEVDWFKVADAQEEITLDFVIPGVCDIPMRGDVRDAKAGTKVDQTNTVNFTFHGARTDGN